MPFPIALAIGALVGLAKSKMVDEPKEERQRQLAAATQRFSPWTGLQAGKIEEADPFGNAMNYGAMGAGMQDQGFFGKAGSMLGPMSEKSGYKAGPVETYGANVWGKGPELALDTSMDPAPSTEAGFWKEYLGGFGGRR
jgi:hypothetical protein